MGAATQYVCEGWTGSGSVTNGWGTNTLVTLTNDSVLTWQWATNYWLEVATGGMGTVNTTSGWQVAGITTAITASADTYYHFTNWTGSVSGGAVYSNPLNLLLDAAKAVVVQFAENVTTNTGTPQWWLAHYCLGTNDEAAVGHGDDDGMANWKEFIAGTDPTNKHSVFSVSNLLTQAGNTSMVVSWYSVSGKYYRLTYCQNLTSNEWSTLTGNIPAIVPLNVVTVDVFGASQRFYRIQIEQ